MGYNYNMNSIIYIVSRFRGGKQMNIGSFPEEIRSFSLLESVLIEPGTRAMSTGSILLDGGKSADPRH